MAFARVARLIGELRARPSPDAARDAIEHLTARSTTADAALAKLVGSAIGIGAMVAEIAPDDETAARGGARVGALSDGEVAVVRIAPGVFTRVPTAEARIRLLELARRAATDAVVVHVRVDDEGSYLGRAAIDLPRRLLARAGVPVAEPGDRFGPAAYVHCFFDEEALLDEIARAGLAVTRRSGFTFVLEKAGASASANAREKASPFAAELRRVVAVVREIDQRRAQDVPERALAIVRARGAAAAAHRGPVGRARLRRAIGWVDALMPGGRSCYRRILLEIALDAGAARETVVFGLDVGRTGHVAFQDREERAFDVSFAIPAD